jgi:hypothetical protein
MNFILSNDGYLLCIDILAIFILYNLTIDERDTIRKGGF